MLEWASLPANRATLRLLATSSYFCRLKSGRERCVATVSSGYLWYDHRTSNESRIQFMAFVLSLRLNTSTPSIGVSQLVNRSGYATNASLPCFWKIGRNCGVTVDLFS